MSSKKPAVPAIQQGTVAEIIAALQAIPQKQKSVFFIGADEQPQQILAVEDGDYAVYLRPLASLPADPPKDPYHPPADGGIPPPDDTNWANRK